MHLKDQSSLSSVVTLFLNRDIPPPRSKGGFSCIFVKLIVTGKLTISYSIIFYGMIGKPLINGVGDLV